MWGLSVTGVSGRELDDQNEVAVSHGEERMRCRRGPWASSERPCTNQAHVPTPCQLPGSPSSRQTLRGAEGGSALSGPHEHPSSSHSLLTLRWVGQGQWVGRHHCQGGVGYKKSPIHSALAVPGAHGALPPSRWGRQPALQQLWGPGWATNRSR